MQHKYAVGDKVTITIEGVVSELMPYTFVEPGYIVKVGKVALAVSERSIERIE
jgi:ribosomal protein L21E